MKEMKMKRFLSVILCMCLCVMLTACGSGTGSKQDAYVGEGAAKLGSDIRSGEFVLDGEVYSFPMDLKVWLDRGWHVSNNYENKDEFLLQPGNESNEFELFNEDGDYIRVAVYNITDEPLKIDDCLVSSLYMSLTEVDLVFPGSIYKGSKPADIVAAYGEPDINDDSESGFFDVWYNFTDSNNWFCQVNVNAFDNNTTINPFSAVQYILVGDSDWTDFLTHSEGEEGCINYIDSALAASFYGDFSEYVPYFDTEENAQILYQNEIEWYVLNFLDGYSGINYDEANLDDDTINELCDLGAQVLGKTKWEISIVDFDESRMTGTVELKLYPTDFLDICMAEIENIQAGTEDEYVEKVMEICRAKAAETQLKEPVVKTYEVDQEVGFLTSENWDEIDDIIMGLD